MRHPFLRYTRSSAVLLQYLEKYTDVLQFEFKDGAFELLSVARPSKYQALPFVEKFAKNFYVEVHMNK